MRNIKLVLAYDGTRYLGWQKTKMGLSVEEALEKAIFQIVQHPVSLQAASRTDAGVHAEGQIVNFFTEKTLEEDRLCKSINALLPDDISALLAKEAPVSFHPTLDCRSKEYHYSLCLGATQLPFYRSFSWHFPYTLDIEAMQKGAGLLIGEHDFSSFTNEPKENNVRELYRLDILPQEENRLKIVVAGNNFLYKMVRNIVGTLVYIGCGKLQIADLPKIIDSKDRTLAGVTAPARGLCLKQVNYD